MLNQKTKSISLFKGSSTKWYKEKYSIVFEDSNPWLISSWRQSYRRFMSSNIPIVLDENIKLDCILDTLGDENNVANTIKGSKLKKSYVDYSFLNDFLMRISNAKN